MRTENAPSLWEHEFLPSQVSIKDSLATRKATAHWQMKRRAIACGKEGHWSSSQSLLMTHLPSLLDWRILAGRECLYLAVKAQDRA